MKQETACSRIGLYLEQKLYYPRTIGRCCSHVAMKKKECQATGQKTVGKGVDRDRHVFAATGALRT